MLCLGIVGPHTHVDAAWHVKYHCGPNHTPFTATTLPDVIGLRRRQPVLQSPERCAGSRLIHCLQWCLGGWCLSKWHPHECWVPTEHGTVPRWSLLFTSPVSGFNVVAMKTIIGWSTAFVADPNVRVRVLVSPRKRLTNSRCHIESSQKFQLNSLSLKSCNDVR